MSLSTSYISGGSANIPVIPALPAKPVITHLDRVYLDIPSNPYKHHSNASNSVGVASSPTTPTPSSTSSNNSSLRSPLRSPSAVSRVSLTTAGSGGSGSKRSPRNVTFSSKHLPASPANNKRPNSKSNLNSFSSPRGVFTMSSFSKSPGSIPYSKDSKVSRDTSNYNPNPSNNLSLLSNSSRSSNPKPQQLPKKYAFSPPNPSLFHKPNLTEILNSVKKTNSSQALNGQDQTDDHYDSADAPSPRTKNAMNPVLPPSPPRQRQVQTQPPRPVSGGASASLISRSAELLQRSAEHLSHTTHDTHNTPNTRNTLNLSHPSVHSFPDPNILESTHLNSPAKSKPTTTTTHSSPDKSSSKPLKHENTGPSFITQTQTTQKITPIPHLSSQVNQIIQNSQNSRNSLQTSSSQTGQTQLNTPPESQPSPQKLHQRNKKNNNDNVGVNDYISGSGRSSTDLYSRARAVEAPLRAPVFTSSSSPRSVDNPNKPNNPTNSNPTITPKRYQHYKHAINEKYPILPTHDEISLNSDPDFKPGNLNLKNQKERELQKIKDEIINSWKNSPKNPNNLNNSKKLFPAHSPVPNLVNNPTNNHNDSEKEAAKTAVETEKTGGAGSENKESDSLNDNGNKGATVLSSEEREGIEEMEPLDEEDLHCIAGDACPWKVKHEEVKHSHQKQEVVSQVLARHYQELFSKHAKLSDPSHPNHPSHPNNKNYQELYESLLEKYENLVQNPESLSSPKHQQNIVLLNEKTPDNKGDNLENNPNNSPDRPDDEHIRLYQKQMNQNHQQILDLTAEIDKEKLKNRELTAHLDSVSDQYKAIHGYYKVVTDQLEQLTGHYETLKDTHADLKGNHDDLKQESASARLKHESEARKIEQERQVFRKQENEKNDIAQKGIDTLTDLFSEVCKEKEGLEHEIHTLKLQLEQAKDDLIHQKELFTQEFELHSTRLQTSHSMELHTLKQELGAQHRKQRSAAGFEVTWYRNGDIQRSHTPGGKSKPTTPRYGQAVKPNSDPLSSPVSARKTQLLTPKKRSKSPNKRSKSPKKTTTLRTARSSASVRKETPRRSQSFSSSRPTPKRSQSTRRWKNPNDFSADT